MTALGNEEEVVITRCGALLTLKGGGEVGLDSGITV